MTHSCNPRTEEAEAVHGAGHCYISAHCLFVYQQTDTQANRNKQVCEWITLGKTLKFFNQKVF